MAHLDEQHARTLDSTDPVPSRRGEFLIPPYREGDAAYFAGNSLGLQPRAVRDAIGAELDDWARVAVEGWFEAGRPWVSYAAQLREPTARIVGAKPDEVVVMNTLTVNLHLMMASFYRPTPSRFRILIEDAAFPSDSYAVRSQAAFHGYDPDEAVVRLGGDAVDVVGVSDYLRTHGSSVALVLLGGVNYYDGSLLDIPSITAAAHEAGAVMGWDLAHAAGNVPLRLHDWGVDWAAWCNYKYLNSGPGAIASAFVHERHLADRSLPKLQGWWGNDPKARFVMGPEITPIDTADSWQVSTPPILSMAPVLASLQMFDETGMPALRAKSERLSAYLMAAFDTSLAELPASVITPRDPAQRGAQLSVRFTDHDVSTIVERLRHEHGVYADARQPDVVRFATTPMYVTFQDCWRAATALRDVLVN